MPNGSRVTALEALVLHSVGNQERDVHNRFWRTACLIAVVAAALVGKLSTASELVTESFDDDPYWASFNSRAVNDNYGYSPSTNHAGGQLGEAGGLFGRHDAFDSFYADIDLGGTLSVRESIQSSGRVSIDSTLNPSFNMNISFFDARDPSKGGDALRIHIVEGGRFLVWLRQVVGKTHQSPITSGLVNGDYQWTMSWNPAGNGGLGSGTVTFNGLTPGTPAALSATLNMPVRNEPGKPARWIDENTIFNAFGLQAYDAESTAPGQYRVFIDDVSYTAVTAPGTVAAWKLRGSGAWGDSRNWIPGEPPVGNDRTARFGAGLMQNATIVATAPVSAKSIQFDNGAFSYAVAGTSTVTLDDVNNVQASIEVAAGQHQIQTPLSLADNTLIVAAPDTRLDFNNVVSLNGRTLSISGGGTVSLNHLVDAGGGTVLVSSAELSSQGGTLLGNLVLSEASVLGAGLDPQSGAEAPLRVQGAASLAGTIDLGSLPKGRSPVGATFTIITASSLTDDGLRLSAHDARWYELLISRTSVAVRAIAAPEPGSCALMAACGAVVLGTRRRRRCRGRACLRPAAMFAMAGVMLATPASAELIGQHFNADPGWTGINNILPHGSPARARDDFNNFGYNAVTSNALGSPGEVGGYFGMNTFDSYYGDTTLGGNLGGGAAPLTKPLFASGKLMVNADHSPTWNMNIGFFDANNFGASGDAVRFALIELSPGYRLRLEIRQQGNNYNGPLLDGPNHLLDGMYQFELAYNPTGGFGGAGRLSLRMWGPMTVSTFVDVDANGKTRPMSLNAFGFTNYNSGVSRPDTNKHYTFLDDVVYTTQEAADPVVRWAGPGGGSWTDAARWQRASSVESGGFVPDGDDRTAIFSGGATQPVAVFVDRDVRVRRVEFNNVHRHTLAGAAHVLLESNSGPATIELISGSHEFQAAVRLNSDAVLTVVAGHTLTFQNAVELNGRTLNIAANSQVVLNSRLEVGAEGIVANAGRLGGIGRINGQLRNLAGGTVAPGMAAGQTGQLLVDGDFFQTSGGKLAIDLGGAANNEFDALHVGGVAFLNGSLKLALLGGFTPQPGDRFQVLATAGGIDAASLTSLTLTGQSWGFKPIVDDGGTSLVLRYLDADFNDDNIVDAADLTRWRGGMPSVGVVHSQGDADGDLDVDGTDFLVWQRQLGTGPAIGAALAVPEPVARLLVAWIAAGVLVRRRLARR